MRTAYVYYVHIEVGIGLDPGRTLHLEKVDAPLLWYGQLRHERHEMVRVLLWLINAIQIAYVTDV